MRECAWHGAGACHRPIIVGRAARRDRSEDCAGHNAASQGACPRLRIEADRKNLLAGCDVVTDRKVRLLWDRDVIEPGELFFLSCSTVAPHIRWESNHYLGRAFRKSIKSEPDKVRASRRDCRYTGESIAIPKEKLRNSRDGAQSKNKAVSRL